MRKFAVLCLAVVVVAGSAAYATAQGKSRGGRDAARPASTGSGVDIDVDLVFGSNQIRLIRDWFGDSRNLEGLPPGLAKRDSLPPGLERQLRRNGTLPPGLQGKLYPFPVELESRLPELRPGVSRVVIGGSIVLLDGDLILDVAAIF